MTRQKRTLQEYSSSQPTKKQLLAGPKQGGSHGENQTLLHDRTKGSVMNPTPKPKGKAEGILRENRPITNRENKQSTHPSNGALCSLIFEPDWLSVKPGIQGLVKLYILRPCPTTSPHSSYLLLHPILMMRLGSHCVCCSLWLFTFDSVLLFY